MSSVSTQGISAIISGCTSFGCSFTAFKSAKLLLSQSNISTFLVQKLILPLRMACFPRLPQFSTFFTTASGYGKTSKIRLTTTAPVSITRHLIDPCLLPDVPKYMQLCWHSTFSFVIPVSILASTYSATSAFQSRL